MWKMEFLFLLAYRMPSRHRLGTCTGKSSLCRSILATCTENKMASEEENLTVSFWPRNIFVEHFCKMARALLHQHIRHFRIMLI